jgi:2-polyprenyl-3-methyl-5-hydroxy-6-metoxy-1,4-benzoquinol methylase
MLCPLCGKKSTTDLLTEQRRHFFRCAQCDLVFLNPSQRLSLEDEKARYEEHNNDVNDPRYQDFVRPLFDLVCEIMEPGASGLDFGAGTGPVLSEMLESNGYRIQRYDPFFWPNARLLDLQYDFVATSEVVEHFANPADEFARLRGLLRPRGLLGVMTLLHDDSTDFESWYYLKDPTHICAYSENTFKWIAREFGFQAPDIRSERLISLIPADH